MFRHSYTITPNDGNDLPKPIKLLYVGSGGDIVLELEKDTSPITISVTPGQIIKDLLIRKIHATGTTASNLIGVY